MSTEENKALVRRWFEEVWSQYKTELIDEIAAEDFVLHHTSLPGQPIDLQTYKQHCAVFLAAFPDLPWTVEAMIAEEDLVAVRAIQTGTHLGQFFDLAPSGKPIYQPLVAMYRCAGGRIAEAWAGERDWNVTVARAAEARGD